MIGSSECIGRYVHGLILPGSNRCARRGGNGNGRQKIRPDAAKTRARFVPGRFAAALSPGERFARERTGTGLRRCAGGKRGELLLHFEQEHQPVALALDTRARSPARPGADPEARWRGPVPRGLRDRRRRRAIRRSSVCSFPPHGLHRPRFGSCARSSSRTSSRSLKQ